MQAMTEEMNALKKNDTWEVVTLPKGKQPVGCKWVYTLKYKADGTLERYKARLVAKGYTQTYGVDYQETFAPVAKMNTIRILLSLAANFGWSLQQFDVKNAFLHADLEEEVFMEPGFDKDFGNNQVCRLKKALYGLKQSPRAWFGRFTKTMLEMGYKQSRGDHTLFIKHSKEGMVTALLVYVDDIVVTGNDEAEQDSLKSNLAQQFEIKTSYNSCNSIHLSQIWLHHFRLGHPPFSLLKTMFPSIFKDVAVENLHCEVCELAKNHRVSFPLNNNRVSTPFSLIHTNVWGPSRTANFRGAKWFVSFIDDCTRTTWLYLMKTNLMFNLFFRTFIR